MGTLRDWRWWLRSRFARGLTIDRVRMSDEQGRPCELVHPRWWDVRRWLTWLRGTDGHLEVVLFDAEGQPVFLRLRTRATRPPPPALVTVTVDGRRRTIVPGPADPRASGDPRYRLVPDEYLERHGITFRDE